MEDEEIIELYLKRNEEAIRYTSDKYGTKLRHISFRITGDAQTAEECENDTYMEVWKRIPPNEPRNYFFQYLTRIARNISINRCMERNRLKRSAYIVEFTTEMEQCIPSPDDTERRVESEEIGRIISAFLRELPKEKRLLFMQRYFFLDSISSIAKRFGYSESKVKTTLSRVRIDLRKYLIKEGYTL